MRRRITFYFSVPRPLEWIVHTVLIGCAFLGVALKDGYYFVVCLVLYGVYNVLLRACCLETVREVKSDVCPTISVSSSTMSMDDLIVQCAAVETYRVDLQPVDGPWLVSIGFTSEPAHFELSGLRAVFHGDEVDYWLHPPTSRYPVRLPSEIAPRNRSEARALFHRLDLPVKEEIV